MSLLKKFFVGVGKVYIKGIEWVTAVIIVLVSLAMLETAFSRTVFHFPLSAIDKINIILMIWACFLVNGLLILNDQHIQINVLPEKLTGVRLSILKLVINTVVLITCLVTAIYGFVVTHVTFETGVTYTAEIDLPQWPTFLAIAVGMTLAVPACIYMMTKDIRAIRDYFTGRRGDARI